MKVKYYLLLLIAAKLRFTDIVIGGCFVIFVVSDASISDLLDKNYGILLIPCIAVWFFIVWKIRFSVKWNKKIEQRIELIS